MVTTMKKISKYIFVMMFVFAALIIIDIIVLFFICVQKEHKFLDTYHIEKVSDQIICIEGGYYVEPSLYDLFDKTGSFAMIQDDFGEVIWEYNKPSDISDSFVIKDVASFSRWYLNDYPAYTWGRDDGLLVVCHPKGSIWKYDLEVNMETMSSLVKFAPYLFMSNLMLLLLLPVLITRKWMLTREKARTEWIAGVSHDIRTPLSIVMGSVEKGSIEEKQCFKIRELIGNLNTENKLEVGTGKWSNEKINLTPLLREILCDYLNTYEERYSFDLEAADHLESFSINADISLIRRMIENIIRNSIEHNENGCDIKVSLSDNAHGKAVLTIRDNGQGTDKQTITTLNSRVTNTYLPEHGLGLRVVKQIAKKYRYKVYFSSEEKMFFEARIIWL